jgi:hypothetical protein
VILTIDTTQPLNDTDRAVLRALLDGTTSGHAPSPAQRGRSAADLGAAVVANAGRGAGPAASARLAVAAQPGVSFVESTPGDDPDAS